MAIKIITVKPEAKKPEKAVAPRSPKPIPKTKSTAKTTDAPSDTPKKRLRGRPKSGNETITIRLKTETIDQYRSSGDGWRSRLQEDIQTILEKENPVIADGAD